MLQRPGEPLDLLCVRAAPASVVIGGDALPASDVRIALLKADVLQAGVTAAQRVLNAPVVGVEEDRVAPVAPRHWIGGPEPAH